MLQFLNSLSLWCAIAKSVLKVICKYAIQKKRLGEEAGEVFRLKFPPLADLIDLSAGLLFIVALIGAALEL